MKDTNHAYTRDTTLDDVCTCGLHKAEHAAETTTEYIIVRSDGFVWNAPRSQFETFHATGYVSEQEAFDATAHLAPRLSADQMFTRIIRISVN